VKGKLADVEFQLRDDVVFARLAGEVDSSNVDELLTALTGAVPGGAQALVLHIGGVSYLDSAGVEMVFTLGDRLRHRRQRLGLVVPAGAPVERVLEISSVSGAIELAATEEDLLEMLGVDPG
jgi:anti-anti-sigma factor